MKKMWLIVLIVIFLGLIYFFVGSVKSADNILWGVNFSSKQASYLNLNEKDVYLSILDDLKVKNIKIAVHWDKIEPKQGEFDCEILDWQLNEAKKRGVGIILAIGMKTPRWPEAHIPNWANELEKEEQQEAILNMEKYLIERYKDYDNLNAWQIENEPLFGFGENPWLDKKFLKKEFENAKKIDSDNLMITTDSGEMSMWFSVAKIADMVGITMYRKVWSKEFNTYFSYFYPPQYYGRKADLIQKFFNKKVVCVELQAEPWCSDGFLNCSFQEQEKTMNLEIFKENMKFAQKTGLDTFYFWGVEWWYFMKENNRDEIWNEAKKIWN